MGEPGKEDRRKAGKGNNVKVFAQQNVPNFDDFFTEQPGSN